MAGSLRRVGVLLAAGTSILAAILGGMIVVPRGLRSVQTWELATLIGLCVLPLLVALAMTADRRRLRQAAREADRQIAE